MRAEEVDNNNSNQKQKHTLHEVSGNISVFLLFANTSLDLRVNGPFWKVLTPPGPSVRSWEQLHLLVGTPVLGKRCQAPS